MDKLDEKLYRILISECPINEFKIYIRQLLNSTVLDNNEMELCEKVFENMEFYHCTYIDKILKDMKYDINNVNQITPISHLNIPQAIQDFIYDRKQEENQKVIQMGLDDSSKDSFSKKALDVFFKRYASKIEFTDDNTFDSLEVPEDLTDTYSISFAQTYIDTILGGLEEGTVTSIIGDSSVTKSIWALNIAYRAIKEKKNVLYILLGTNKETLYKRFLSRSSCDDKYKHPISFNEINTKYDRAVYDMVYEDFKYELLPHLIVYDEHNLSINTTFSLQSLITKAENNFQSGIDLIIVDDFSYMRLENARRTISNKSTIIHEYYTYLRDQSRSLLGHASIPIVITTNANINMEYIINCNEEFRLQDVMEEIELLSDNILCIYCNKCSKKSGIAKVKVLKSHKEVMQESMAVKLDYDYFWLKYSDDLSEEEDLKLSVEYYKEENKILEETVTSLNDLTLDLMNHKNITPDLMEKVNNQNENESVGSLPDEIEKLFSNLD